MARKKNNETMTKKVTDFANDTYDYSKKYGKKAVDKVQEAVFGTSNGRKSSSKKKSTSSTSSKSKKSKSSSKSGKK